MIKLSFFFQLKSLYNVWACFLNVKWYICIITFTVTVIRTLEGVLMAVHQAFTLVPVVRALHANVALTDLVTR